MAGGITAGEIVERVRARVGVEWRDDTTDVIKTGDPSTVVTGIATSVWSSLEVLERAAAENKNLVISHEPTFWGDDDRSDAFRENALAAAKQAFIDDHELVVFRFHDHWHIRQPDAFWTGLGRVLGWESYADRPRNYGLPLTDGADHFRAQATYRVPTTTLEKLVRGIEQTLAVSTVRVIGQRDLAVENVALCPGYCPLPWVIEGLAAVDVLVAGECREWEGIEYARDLAHFGSAKGLVVLGHAVSEDPGMEECAAWLRELVPELPVRFIPAGEPFWRP